MSSMAATLAGLQPAPAQNPATTAAQQQQQAAAARRAASAQAGQVPARYEEALDVEGELPINDVELNGTVRSARLCGNKDFPQEPSADRVPFLRVSPGPIEDPQTLDRPLPHLRSLGIRFPPPQRPRNRIRTNGRDRAFARSGLVGNGRGCGLFCAAHRSRRERRWRVVGWREE